MQDYYYQRNDEVLTQLNECNFSNDNSIRYLPGTKLPAKAVHTHTHISNKANCSSQNTLMYLSMQDSSSRIISGNAGNGQQNAVGGKNNLTNTHDSSNNYPYGNSQQAEMSTCISNGLVTSKNTILDVGEISRRAQKA